MSDYQLVQWADGTFHTADDLAELERLTAELEQMVRVNQTMAGINVECSERIAELEAYVEENFIAPTAALKGDDDE